MTSRPYDSLRERLVPPFVLLGFVVSALLSLTTFALVAELEERAIRRMLQVEMESFRNRQALHTDALPVSATLLQGYYLPDSRFPQISRPKPGTEYTEIMTIGDTDYSVMAAEVGGKPFGLLYDRTYVKSSMAKLALALLIGTGVMTLLSFLIGNGLAGQVVRPIVRLLGEVSAKTTLADPLAASPSFSAAEYPNNEIGRLVRELDQFALRLYGFLQRESYFAADVSHELRTPIAVIRGAAEVLVEHPELPVAVRQRLATIHRHAVRATEILEAMLLLAREGGEDDDPNCVIADVVKDVVADCTPALAGLPVDIVTHVEGRPILPVERSLAYVVVSNLLRNACAHTKQGRIDVRVGETGIEIADTGMGIAEDRFPELFERHVKGEESQGNGLGLSIVARITDMIGWKVSFASRPGLGTTVRVSFATDRPGPAVPAAGKGSAARPA